MSNVLGFLAFLGIWLMGVGLIQDVFDVQNRTWLMMWGAVIFMIAKFVEEIIKA